MHPRGQLRRPERPAFLQHGVVEVFQAQAGDFAEHVERVQQFLQVHHADFARPLLLLHHLPQRIGGGPMASAGVEEDEVELAHLSDCAMRTPGARADPVRKKQFP